MDWEGYYHGVDSLGTASTETFLNHIENWFDRVFGGHDDALVGGPRGGSFRQAIEVLKV
jgi:hypothetical protein